MFHNAELAGIVAQAQNQPLKTFEAVCALAGEVVGIKLFTMTRVDRARKEARRIFSNMPDAYPLQGVKPMHDDPWSARVLERRQVFVANDIEAISNVFDDYELIRSLGCESVVNIPIVVAGEVLGTLNCLHEAHHYQPEIVDRCGELKIPGALAFLLSNSNDTMTKNGVH